MVLKNNAGTYFFRIILLIIIILCIYFIKINYNFFGFLIILSLILFLFTGYNKLTISEFEIEIGFQRIIPVFSSTKIIPLTEIKSIEYFERKMTTLRVILNLIEYIPRPDDQIIIESTNGNNIIISKISSKKKFKNTFEEIDKVIKKHNRTSYKGKSYSKI